MPEMRASADYAFQRKSPPASAYAGMALAAAVITVLASATTIPAVLHGTLIDPDSYMRLVRLRQGLHAGHLLNVVRRDDSGQLLVVEWSRLFDAWIMALAAPLAPLLGWHRALFAAGVATGPLSAGLLAAALGFAAAPLTEGRWLWAPAIIAPLLPGIRSFNGFGVVHYHIAQVALTALALGCTLRAGLGARRMGWAAGMFGGLAIWLMPETMPFVMLGYSALGYAWLFRPLGATLARLGAGFAAILWVALWIDPPHGGWLTPEIDRLSIVYAMLGLAVSIVGICLAGLDRKVHGNLRMGLGIAAAGTAFAAWLATYPTVALGPYALIPVREMHAFFGGIIEDQPATTLSLAASRLAPGLLALAYALHRAWRCRHAPDIAGLWLILIAGLALALGLTARMMIFQQYPAAFAVALAPLALDDISRHFAARPSRAALLRVGLVWAPVVLVYVPGMAAAALRPDPAKPAGHCSLQSATRLLAPTAGQIVLTDPGLVPELIYRTEAIGVGSLYHHGLRAFMRDRAAWRTPAGAAEPTAVRATEATFVLFCAARGNDSALVAGAKQGALWHLLAANTPPPWLKRVGQAGGYQLYLIRQQAKP